jgi:hypothetical protein
MNEATVKITGVILPVLTFLIILLSLKWRIEVFAKGSVADSPLTLHKEGKLTDVLTDPFIKMIKGMSWESLLSPEISQTKKRNIN